MEYNDPMKDQQISSLAVFEPTKEGGYNVSFPEYPGCVTFGRTFEEAEQMAKEALELWLEETGKHSLLSSARSTLFPKYFPPYWECHAFA